MRGGAPHHQDLASFLGAPDRINSGKAARNRSPYAQNSGSSMPDWTSLLGCAGGAVLAVWLIRYYRDHYTRSGWLRSGQEASHRLHRA